MRFGPARRTRTGTTLRGVELTAREKLVEAGRCPECLAPTSLRGEGFGTVDRPQRIVRQCTRCTWGRS